MVFEMDEIVRYSQTDRELRLTVPALLDFFQDAATFQAGEAGVGVDVLNANGRNLSLPFQQPFRKPKLLHQNAGRRVSR